MFAFLRGTVAHMDIDTVALDVGGVGYELHAPSKTLDRLKVGEEATLKVHMHMAQDLIALYGFYTSEEKAMFRRLISITRVGPKVALAALSALRAEELAAAIVTGDERTLGRVPGIGKKAAQRIILELKEKIATEEAFSGASAALSFGDDTPAGADMRQEAISALIALGYDASTAARAIASAPPADKVESLITSALRSLSKLG